MVYEIILGREQKDREKYGTKGAVLIGKHYVKMGAVTTLSQPVYMDLNKAHVVFVCGKRGTGKSYCMGVIAEGIASLPDDMRDQLSVILLDTMGIYWTMKFPNHKDEALLKEWGLEGKAIPVVIYTPLGYYNKWKEQGIPTDKPFAINPQELSPEDWNLTFELESTNPAAVFIERIVLGLKKKGEPYDIPDIIAAIDADESEERTVKNLARNRFIAVQDWGIFSPQATPIKDLVQGGQITVLDLSAYAIMPNGWRIKQLVLGIVTMKLFIERMKARKNEEYASVHQAEHYIIEEEHIELKEKMPICWIMIDEAHEFLPMHGKVASTDALVTLLREGRQPGIAMVLVTQQPGKIHTDAMTQSDIILAHRLTAKIDTDALGNLMQTYMRAGLDKELANLPRVPGACIAIDDVNERMYPMRIRPRFSWHGGGAPGIIQKSKKAFEF
ncbi:ATP-binding protein [Candidatus Woesearchaeota archaeon]|nr:MAG: ATP-binding protein [Candidatus Woesearchaeota archaeon]